MATVNRRNDNNKQKLCTYPFNFSYLIKVPHGVMMY